MTMIEKSAHTPGEWTVGGKTGLLNQIAIEPSIGCAYGAGDEVVANARLIAAAPDLLAALEACYDMIAEECAGGEYTEQAMKARAAIDKAKNGLKK